MLLRRNVQLRSRRALRSMASMKSVDESELVDGASTEAILYVNGVRRVLPDGLAHLTLLEYLRDSGLTGTKLGCGEGGCGACTVMISYFDMNLNKCVHCAINACLAPLYSLEGMHVITVEGIGSCRNGLHPIQESLARAHGSQCGFCTPGFVMSMYALLRSSTSFPSDEQIEECLAGNLCRCTGYRPIVDAFRVFSVCGSSLHIDRSMSADEERESICPTTGMPCSCSAKKSSKGSTEELMEFAHTLESVSHGMTCGSSYIEKELIFPPELLFRKMNYLNMCGLGGIKWYRPMKLQHLLTLKEKNPDAKLVVGNTELGIEIRRKRIHHQILISPQHVPELNMLNIKDDGLEIGAAVKLSELLRVLREVVEKRVTHEVSSCKALVGQLKWFAGTQIKNVASVGGNICTASPISDLNPLWIAAGARFTVVDTRGNQRDVLAEKFFLGYRKVDLGDDEVLLSIFLPWSRPFEYVREFKQSHRRDDDIAIVNAGIRVHLQREGVLWMVMDASIAYGGVAPLPLPATNTQRFLIGRKWNQELLEGALKVLEGDIVLKDDAPGGMVEFRKSLMLSFFFKFFLWVSHETDGLSNNMPASYLSAVQTFQKPSTIGSQDYEIIERGTAVGSPAIHLSSQLQVTGEAEYTDDTPMPSNGLHAALVLSSRPHARIISLDASKAKISPGFIGLYVSKDVPGSNNVGPVIIDEELFASEFVTCVGQLIGVVVADTHENAIEAARKVIIHYQELPAVLSIREAIETESFHPNSERVLRKGDADLCFLSGQCDRILEGEVQISGQEHFYLEPNSSLVWTVDGGNEVHMISSTQAPQKHQKYVATVLGLPMSKVVCKTKRIGGGFGGKETRSALFAAAASIPSYLLDRPVKLTLERDTDMMISGQRHSFLGNYKVGYTIEGKILALDLEIYNNGGNSLDLSIAVLERAMFHSDNVYEIPNICIRGRVCCTNFPSNTAFRGFGAPQGMLITETWIQRIAMDLKRSPEEIRENNFQSEGSVLHYGQQLQGCTLNHLWNELKSCCSFTNAREEVNKFNLRNRWRKRGIAMVPTKFGISFTLKLMNQAGALVQVYTDGTVLVTHGGVEMGQGLHTKIAQVAASAFDIPLNSVFISETSTDKVPNASPTAASASSDMYGAAVLDACEQIKARMLPIASKHGLGSFAEIASMCYRERVDLSAHGFFITPDIGFDWSTGRGSPFRYFTYGAAFAEVEIDTLTGDFHTRAVNVHLDLGYSLNPAIDIGQIEGAFVQGLGWVALEELKWGDGSHRWISPGCLYTCGPGTYKIPSVNDVPLKFNISLLKGTPNAKAIHSSKAVGEPPFFLASSVFFAIKDAIIAARAEEGYHEWFPLDNPATPERIRMACVDRFTAPFADADFRSKLSV